MRESINKDEIRVLVERTLAGEDWATVRQSLPGVDPRYLDASWKEWVFRKVAPPKPPEPKPPPKKG